MYQPNLQSVALHVPEIIVIVVLVGVANPQSWGSGGRGESGMVPFERALVSSYTPSIVTPTKTSIAIISGTLYAFLRYCHFCAPAHHFFPPHL